MRSDRIFGWIVTTVVTAAFGMSSAAIAQLPPRAPPPTAISATEVVGVDAASGSAVLQWTPAKGPKGEFKRYLLTGACQYKGLPSGGTSTRSNNQVIYEGPPYRVLATCNCGRVAYFDIYTLPSPGDNFQPSQKPTPQVKEWIPCKK